MADRSFSVASGSEILRRTPGVLNAMLRGLDDDWAHSNYGEGTFSPFDVVGHLIQGERHDWIPRARIILTHGVARAFDPFDRYAMHEATEGKHLSDLLDEFAELRAGSLAALSKMKLSEHELALRGAHPALGRVTLGELLATWVAHDLNHIGQIAKCLAFQYERAVGPWRAYLSILKSKTTRQDD